jgi:putative transposase
VREIIGQIADECGVKIKNGVLSADHVHIFAEIPPHLFVSEFVKHVKGRSSHKIQQEFPYLKKEYWGRHFWGRGYFSSISGKQMKSLNQHSDGQHSGNVNNISLD